MIVAVLMIGNIDLSGGGGAERFFADFFSRYNNQSIPKRNLFFISNGIHNLQKIGKLLDNQDKVLIVKLYRNRFLKKHTEKNRILRNVSNTLRDYFPYLKIKRYIKQNNISIVHIPLYEKKDYHLLKLLDVKLKKRGLKIVINIVDCLVPYNYYKTEKQFHYSSAQNYGKLFDKVRIDGVLSWYRLFKEFAERDRIINSNPVIEVIKSRYAGCEIYDNFDEKQNKIVYATRMVVGKNPLFFVEAVYKLVNRPAYRKGVQWKFEMYGKGGLLEDVKRKIAALGLNDTIEMKFHDKMPEIFKGSKCYVSTQDFENFPSLSMAEAMANGNAIIARNVGQTDYFVKHEKNGYLLGLDSPEELADTMQRFIENPDVHRPFSIESIRLIREVHNPENFIKQADNFWDKVLAKS